MPLRNLTIPALALVLPLFGSCGGGTPAAPGDPEATVEFFARGINENNPAVIWACLPDSYKKDLQGLVVDGGDKPHFFGGLAAPEEGLGLGSVPIARHLGPTWGSSGRPAGP